MSDIYREVDEELRKDQYLRLWKQYGRYLVAAAVILIAAIAAYMGWNRYQTQQHQEQTAQLVEAMNELDRDNREAALNTLATLRQNAGPGVEVFARFQEANILLQQGKREAALEIYNDIAAREGLDRIWRQLAELKAIILSMDSADPAKLRGRLEPLTIETAPWRLSALEQKGVLEFRAGNMKAAAEAFRTLLQGSDTPESLRARARDMLRAIGPVAEDAAADDAIDAAEETPPAGEGADTDEEPQAQENAQ